MNKHMHMVDFMVFLKIVLDFQVIKKIKVFIDFKMGPINSENQNMC